MFGGFVGDEIIQCLVGKYCYLGIQEGYIDLFVFFGLILLVQCCQNVDYFVEVCKNVCKCYVDFLWWFFGIFCQVYDFVYVLDYEIVVGLMCIGVILIEICD